MTNIENVSKKLNFIRNKTHYHFSHEYVEDYKKVWEGADLNGLDLLGAIGSIQKILSFLHEKEYGESRDIPDYDGEDAKAAAKFVSSFKKRESY